MTGKYKLRTGVVPVTVCGETILVAGREVRGECPYTLHLSELSAYCFSLLIKGLNSAEMTDAVSEYCKIDAESAVGKVNEFIGMLKTYDYLVSEDGE